MYGLLAKKVILITGASGGIGRIVAVDAAKEGAFLSLTDIDSDSLEETKKAVLNAVPDTKILLTIGDVTKEEDVKNYVQATVDEYGRIDGFYNNAGIDGPQVPFCEYDSALFRKVIDINVTGVFYGMKHVLKVMLKQDYGAIVNVSSVSGIQGVGLQAGYNASKHAVSGMTKVAAIDYGTSGVHINAIAPGAILTEMVKSSCMQRGGENWEEYLDSFMSNNPTKRVGQPEEVSQLVIFLLSEKSTYINGTVIPIDGGQSNQY